MTSLPSEKQSWFSRVRARIETATGAFGITERIVFGLAIVAFVASGLLLLWNLNTSYLVEVPEPGGTLVEGIVGTPRFINPVTAVSDADRDMVALVYSGLLTFTEDGTPKPNLASSYTISEDGRTYSFILREDATFHDGTPVTTDDVEFTIQKIQDPAIKSPRRPAWDGVVINKKGTREISFTIRQPYAPFIENVSVGILPKHIWQSVPVEEFPFSTLNMSPIGSGPYRVSSVKRDSIGLPISYQLARFKDYALGSPYIKNIVAKFYQSEADLMAAYKDGDIESLGGVSAQLTPQINTQKSNIIHTPLARVFGVFFNQNQASVFVHKEVRQALDLALDKNAIVTEVLRGYGTTTNTPLPTRSSSAGPAAAKNLSAESISASTTAAAIELLNKNGWVLNTETGIMEKTVNKEKIPLSFSLSTGSAPELKHAAEMVRDMWQKIGARVELRVFDIGDLNQNVIRPRKYDALFFGEVVGMEYDLYPFWHSSQRNDPGLNIALYTNIKADTLLEEIRSTTDRAVRLEKWRQLEGIIAADIPVVFVYTPDYIYVTPKKLRSVQPDEIINTSDRFTHINRWYIDTNNVWKIFN